MKLATCLISGAVLCMPAMADTIDYDGKQYLTIDWDQSPRLGDDGMGVYGYAGGIEVFFGSEGLVSDQTAEHDYSTDAAFDAVSFGEATMESLTLLGGQAGTSRLSFSSAVGDILIFVGSPDQASSATQFGASRWDFQDESISLDIVDSEQTNGGLQLVDGRVSSPVATQISGIIGASAGLTEGISLLEWIQSSNGGLDRMQISFAISVVPVPAPASGLALLISAPMLVRRRR